MSFQTIRRFFLPVLVCFTMSCAQIVPPQGGSKDITPPKLLSVTPGDSLLNTRVTRIEMRFDEFINLNNPAGEMTISPILPFAPELSVAKRSVIVKIADSLLQDNTTYRISFGKAIQDVHEGNPFTGYSYMFSTGSFFDSLQLNGFVTDAATGMRDTGALVLLYDAVRSDSAVLREKPLYAIKADGRGDFSFTGLPDRDFKIYALRDANNNMMYDGAGEMIAFSDSIARPSRTGGARIRLDLFTETDSAGNIPAVTGDQPFKRTRSASADTPPAGEGFTYTVSVDTTDTRKRGFDITKALEINFSKPVAAFNGNRINLSYDSSGVSVEAPAERVEDTARRNTLLLGSAWKENTLYTLRLLKGFARDSAGTDAMPGRYTFRTKRDEDYAKLHVHLPSGYSGSRYLFVLLNGSDTVYHRAVTDTLIHFTRLQAATYTMRVIVDRNGNGKWDTGDLLDKIQPEEVIPYTNPVNLKAGWENMIDFEAPDKGKDKNSTGASPGRRDAPQR